MSDDIDVHVSIVKVLIGIKIVIGKRKTMQYSALLVLVQYSIRGKNH